MFEAAQMLFLYVESPLHAGSGRGLEAVDLPIQRERVTGYPLVQGSGLKGCLRAQAELRCPQSGSQISAEEIKVIFGPATDNASDHAGALAVGDARLLLLPVRSLAGVFAWTTSLEALARLARAAKQVGTGLKDQRLNGTSLKLETFLKETSVKNDTVLVSSNTALDAGNIVVLEEFSFQPCKPDGDPVGALGRWLAENALPKTSSANGGDEYDYWRKALPTRLCILPEDAFRDFALYGMEVRTHIKLNPETKTVDADAGALWTVESLPADSLLYAPLLATQPRKKVNGLKTASDVIRKLRQFAPRRMQLGGDETTGQGMVALRLWGGQE